VIMAFGVPVGPACGRAPELACGPSVEISRGHESARCLCSRVQSPVPDSYDEVRVADSQGAGKVNGVRAAKSALTG